MLDPVPGERPQTTGEEIANSVSHGVGFLAAIIGIPFLIRHAALFGARSIVGASIFSATIVILYLTSTLYHALPRGKVKHAFRLIEHGAIFFLIAGTYTPFTLGVLHGVWGWTLFGILWTLALGGVLLKIFGGVRFPTLSTALYVAMGWVVVIAVKPMWRLMPHAGLLWILLGGLAYTGGVVFYVADQRMRYSHFVWHLFVMAGTTLHYVAVYGYAS